jgi:parvulin-like peptidyl-prolyl isomerase
VIRRTCSARRRGLLLATGAAVAVALTGCHSVVHAGAAATIDNHRISFSDLSKATDALYTGPVALSATRVQVQDEVLHRMLDNAIDERIAAQLGLPEPTASEVRDYVGRLEQQLGGPDALAQAAAQQGIYMSAATITQYFAQYLREQKIAQQLFTENPPRDAILQSLYTSNLQVFVNQQSQIVLVKDKATADTVKAQAVADPATFGDLVTRYSIDKTTKANGGDTGQQPKGTYDSALEDAIFAAKPGEVLGPVQTAAGYYVVKVMSVTDTPFAQARGRLLSALRTGEADNGRYVFGLLAARRVAVAKTIDIHVSSRFGSWSPATGQIGPDLAALSVAGKGETGPTATTPLTGATAGNGSTNGSTGVGAGAGSPTG